MIMYELLGTQGRARRGRFVTPHGTVETPVFMNVGTVGAIKGAVSTDDLKEIGCQIELSNTYHLHDIYGLNHLTSTPLGYRILDTKGISVEGFLFHTHFFVGMINPAQTTGSINLYIRK